MEWQVEFLKEAQKDLKRLDMYNRKLVLKAIDTVGTLEKWYFSSGRLARDMQACSMFSFGKHNDLFSQHA